MDNLTHTLVGAALGYAGLKRRTGLAMPALMIGANLPDIDVLAGLFGEGFSARRGWTHGPIGVLVLPLLLTFVLVQFDRWQASRGRRPAGRAVVQPGQVLLLSYLGALSHPLLDLMNTWGIRLLMPFSERWFYGDALFIADPWIWLALAGGLWLSRRRQATDRRDARVPAFAALVVVSLYGGAMALAGRAAEAHVTHHFWASGLREPERVLASPVFANPFRRTIVVQTGDQYGFGDFRWLPGPRLWLDDTRVSTRMHEPAVAEAARQDPAVADFLYWSRYPFATIRNVPDGLQVSLGDARYGADPEAALIGVRTTIATASAHNPGDAQHE